MNSSFMQATSKAVLASLVMSLPSLGCANGEAALAPDWSQQIERMDALSSDQLGEVAKGEDRTEAGYAEWALGLRAAFDDPPRSRRHIARAAILLRSSQPILKYGRTFLFDDALREQALPYLLLAKELGGSWVDARLSSYTAEQTEKGAMELAALKEEIMRPGDAP